MSNESSAASGGIGIGSVIAIVLSWTANHSIGWMILHGILGWVYVIARIGGCADGGVP